MEDRLRHRRQLGASPLPSAVLRRCRPCFLTSHAPHADLRLDRRFGCPGVQPVARGPGWSRHELSVRRPPRLSSVVASPPDPLPLRSKTNYTPKPSPNVGAIVGGLFGALAGIALLCALIWWRRRAWKRAHPNWNAHRADSKAGSVIDPDDVCLADGPAGIARAGTYNLGQVNFTEDSLTRLRAIDTPPAYAPPPRRSTSQEATVVDVIEEEERPALGEGEVEARDSVAEARRPSSS